MYNMYEVQNNSQAPIIMLFFEPIDLFQVTNLLSVDGLRVETRATIDYTDDTDGLDFRRLSSFALIIFWV